MINQIDIKQIDTGTPRGHVLAQIITLARTHDIGAAEITRHLAQGSAADDKSSLLVKMLSYIGGLLVFSGICVLVSMQWDDFSSAQRVLITLGTGFIALILALAALRDARFAMAVTPLFLMAAFLQPAGLFVVLQEYAHGNDAVLGALLVFTPMAAQSGLLFSQTRRTALLLFSVIFAGLAAWAGMDKIGMDGQPIAIAIGLSGLILTARIGRGAHGVLVPWLYFAFTAIFAGGVFDMLDRTGIDVLLLPVAGFLMLAAIKARSRSFLFTAVVVMLCYLGYYTDRYFADAVGWPIALIVMGLVMIGLSAWAVKLARNIKQSVDIKG